MSCMSQKQALLVLQEKLHANYIAALTPILLLPLLTFLLGSVTQIHIKREGKRERERQKEASRSNCETWCIQTLLHEPRSTHSWNLHNPPKPRVGKWRTERLILMTCCNNESSSHSIPPTPPTLSSLVFCGCSFNTIIIQCQHSNHIHVMQWQQDMLCVSFIGIPTCCKNTIQALRIVSNCRVWWDALD